MPYRELPATLQRIGLLKSSRSRGLIEFVLWYETDGAPGVTISGNDIMISPPPAWLPFYQMGRDSMADAIEHDAKCDARKGWLHVALTEEGDLAIEEWNLWREEGDSLDGVPGNGGVASDRPIDRISELKPSHRKAYLERGYAGHRGQRIDSGHPGDRAAYEWLRDHGDEHGNKPVAMETWYRYLREARTALGENHPGRGRPHGSSIARESQI